VVRELLYQISGRRLIVEGRVFNFRTLAAALSLAVLGAGSAQANLVTNGSFETGDTTGWTVDAASSGYGLNPFGTTYGSGMDGSSWAWLAGYELGREFSQTVTGLSVGTTYALTFIMASEYSNSDQINVSVNGGADSLFTAPPDTGGFWNNWVTKELDFVATSTSATIEFDSYGLNTSGYDVGIDKVALNAIGQAVPEPATLLLVGTGLFGFAARRRRGKAKA
jgi:hypothetical protein